MNICPRVDIILPGVTDIYCFIGTCWFLSLPVLLLVEQISQLFSLSFFFNQYFTFIKGGTRTDRRRMFNEQRISRGANILFLVLPRVHCGRRSDGGMRPRRTREWGETKWGVKLRRGVKKLIARTASKGVWLSSCRTILHRRGQIAKQWQCWSLKGATQDKSLSRLFHPGGV